MTQLPKLYHELASWWPLFSAPEDYHEEAALYRQTLFDSCNHRPISLLELGSGGGNTASHLKKSFQVTLLDRSEEMLGISRALNPECEHLRADMRSARLERSFDAVLIQDAIMYMDSEADLRAAFLCAFEHLRPGGAALFVPDCVAETFQPRTTHGGRDEARRGLRYLEWLQDPNPLDTRFTADFALLLREENGGMRSVQDRHELGLFPRATWLWLLAEVGFQPRTLDILQNETFLGIRPNAP